ncbi:head-tail joining protein [Roseinatronobacter sp.]
MNAFAAADDILFTDPHLSMPALYRAGGTGDGVPVRVILRTPDRIANFGDGRFVTDSVLIDLRISEVAELARGDTFEVDGTLYEIRSEPVRDAARLIWAAEARVLP